MESIPLRQNPSRKSRARQPQTWAFDQNGPGLAPGIFASSSGAGQPPPRFTVDLSLPPERRYSHIVPHILPQIKDASLVGIFDSLIQEVFPPAIAKLIRRLAPAILRRVYDDEETAELRGIARDTEIPMFLLVAFNVLLDLLLGCTSGGIRVEGRDPRSESGQSSSAAMTAATATTPGWRSTMVHFRTLDWGMETLRHLVVELDFVRHAGGPVVATTITYFGYVGVLTGVRRGLSMSLNFRPYHDTSTRRKRIAFRCHQLRVILGHRRSISSVLRQYLLTPDIGAGGKASGRTRPWKRSKRRDVVHVDGEEGDTTPDVASIISELSGSPSTSVYLIFCTPDRVYSVEKDHRAAYARSSDRFLTTYNHDDREEEDTAAAATRTAASDGDDATGMDTIVNMSVDRKDNVDRLFLLAVGRRRKRLERLGADGFGVEDLLPLVQDPWIVSEETHYATVMDPASGRVLWCRVYPFDNSE